MSLAFIFPGQGSQSVGMLADLAADQPIIEQTFEQASAVLGYPLWALCQSDPDGKLSRTEVTQPALLTASVAIWRLWEALGGARPALLAGHSLGEYSALVCAGSLAFEDAVALVQTRGQLMQNAVADGEGAMAAILGLDDAAVLAACDSVPSGVVSAVNFNAPGQVVIAGGKAAVDAAIEACKQAGARRAMPLPVSVPSHCALMAPAAESMANVLADVEFVTPVLPVVNNVDVAMNKEPEAIRDALVRQLYSPVRWVESMQALAGEGMSAAVEGGPGKVLAGLMKRIDKRITVYATDNKEAIQSALAATAG